MKKLPDDMAMHMDTLATYASRCEKLLEMGVRYGNGSTLAFQQGFRQRAGKLWVSIDHEDVLRPEFRPNEAEFPYWHFIVGDTTSISTRWQVRPLLPPPALGPGFDLVFLDTEHTPDQIGKELALWEPLTTLDALWLFHDTWMKGSYHKMVDTIKKWASGSGRFFRDLTREGHGLSLAGR